MTIEGKPLKDHFEAVNHLQAIEYIREIARDKQEFNRRVLLDIHALILQGIDRANAVSIHAPARALPARADQLAQP